MNILKRIFFAGMLSFGAALLMAAGPGHTSRVASLRGEKWWGIFVGNSPAQPFERPFAVDTEEVSAEGVRIPMLVSSAGRYLWSRHPMRIECDSAGFTIFSDHEQVAVQKGGRNLREAYLVCCHKYFTPDGTPPPVELLTRLLYDLRAEDPAETRSFVERIVSGELPAGTVLLPEEWRTGDGGYGADVREAIAHLHDGGFRVMGTLTPLTAPFGREYLRLKKEGALLTDKAGEPLLMKTGSGYAVACDLATRPDLPAERTEDSTAVDGFLFDFRAPIPWLAQSSADPRQFVENSLARSRTSDLSVSLPGYAAPLKPFVQGVAADGRGWEQLRGIVRDALAAGLCGVPYADLPQTLAEAPRDDLFKLRSLQLGLMMPVPRVTFPPWEIEDSTLRAEAVKAIRFRASLAEYMAGVVRESARTGEPIVRHMEYHFPRNGFSDCDDQFMLGNRYLFVPVVDDAPTRTVRLPRGTWVDRDGNRVKGPVVMTVPTTDGRMICFESSGK